MSGGGVLRGPLKARTPEETRSFWDEVCRLAGVKDMANLKNIEPEPLFRAWKQAQENIKGSRYYTIPVIDGCLIPEYPSAIVKKREQLSVPYMIGITFNDMMPLLLNHLAMDWTRNQKKSAMPPCYNYCFDHALPGDNLGAWHAAELRYAFGTLEGWWRPVDEKDQMVSDFMVGVFSNFAVCGNPNGKDVPDWKAGKRVMRIGLRPRMTSRPVFTLFSNTIFHKGPM